jgi:hypothetical protein
MLSPSSGAEVTKQEGESLYTIWRARAEGSEPITGREYGSGMRTNRKPSGMLQGGGCVCVEWKKGRKRPFSGLADWDIIFLRNVGIDLRIHSAPKPKTLTTISYRLFVQESSETDVFGVLFLFPAFVSGRKSVMLSCQTTRSRNNNIDVQWWKLSLGQFI